ncbi:MAG: bifunctional ADP-heptose synthase [Bacteroidia bacterium]
MITMKERLDEKKLNSIFEDFTTKRVLIVGDVMLDAYWWGNVNRISPEAPVPIVLVKKKEHRLGGAANVALNVKELGGNPVLCSVIGKDYDGGHLTDLLELRGISSDNLIRSKDRPTTVKTRILGNNHQLLRVDNELDLPLTEKDKQHLEKMVDDLLTNIDVVVFEDYDKGLLAPGIISFITGQARKLNIPIVVDPKKSNFNEYHHATLFKPNFKELTDGLKLDVSREFNIDEVREAARVLRKRLSLDMAMITLSEHGVFIMSETEEHLIPAHYRDIYDVSGAGDTVSSVAALALACGLSPYVLAELSNLAGGIVCEHVGVVPIQKEKLLEESIKVFG